MARALPLLALLLVLAATARADEAPDEVGRALTFLDVRGLTRSLDDLGERKATVLVFLTEDCPLGRRALPRLVALEAATRERGARFLLVDVGRDADPSAAAALALNHGVPFPIVLDPDAAAARRCGVTHVPTAVVLDAKGALAYRGRIDDALRPGVDRAPGREELKDALEDVLAGRAARVASTAVDGCVVPAPAARAATAPTWADVAPVLARRCAGCHSTGGDAPFALGSYEEAWVSADTIGEVVRRGTMPPWFADPAVGVFENDRRLSPEERALLLAWCEAGAPLGDPAKAPGPLPPPVRQPEGWRIDAPDLVLQGGEEALPADGVIPYRYVLLPRTFDEDTWLEQAEIRADNPRVMHHCNLAWIYPAEADPRGNLIAGQVPGGEAMRLAPGVAFKVPAGAALVLQVHYVTTGKPERDRIRVGLRFPRVAVKKQLHSVVLSERRLAIPPGAPHHEVRRTAPLPHDASVLALFTHMHVRGKDMTFTALGADGRRTPLLSIPRYAFDWQLSYHVAQGAVRLPRGTTLECVGHYDNSAWNPFNPDPKVTVQEGPQTTDEMFFGFVFYTDDQEQLDLRVDPATGSAVR